LNRLICSVEDTSITSALLLFNLNNSDATFCCDREAAGTIVALFLGAYKFL
jgi:hypothetical protein